MSDTMILTVGFFVFGLMLLGIVLTVMEFRQLPNKQKPRLEGMAAQAQPKPLPAENHEGQ